MEKEIPTPHIMGKDKYKEDKEQYLGFINLNKESVQLLDRVVIIF